MPTIVLVDGLELKIFCHDHLPPHVHVFARACEAIFLLNCAEETVSLRNNYRFKSRELKRIRGLVQKHQALLCEAWEEIHGDLG